MGRSPVHRKGLVRLARLLAVESQLIAEYGEKFGSLPFLDGRRRHLLAKSLKST
jgi:hypothetical protein